MEMRTKLYVSTSGISSQSLTDLTLYGSRRYFNSIFNNSDSDITIWLSTLLASFMSTWHKLKSPEEGEPH